MMAKHGFLVWGPHGELNLSHPGRQPLLTGQTPRRGLLSGQGSCQGHKHSSDSPEFNSQGGRPRGAEKRGRGSGSPRPAGGVLGDSGRLGQSKSLLSDSDSKPVRPQADQIEVGVGEISIFRSCHQEHQSNLNITVGSHGHFETEI